MADTGAVPVETWNSVYKEFHAEMIGVARRLLADAKIPVSRLDAEDVVHTAFVKVLGAPGAVRNPRAYLYAVIRREVVAEVRRCGPPAEWEASPSCGAAHAGEPAVVDFSDMVTHRIVVRQALNELPPQQRTAVWATKAMGRTQRETAEAMGKSEGTVATHVMRAVALLKAGLVSVGVCVVTVLCGLAGPLAARLSNVGDEGREPTGTPMSDFGLSSWQAMMLGAVLLPLAFDLFGRLLPWLRGWLKAWARGSSGRPSGPRWWQA